MTSAHISTSKFMQYDKMVMKRIRTVADAYSTLKPSHMMWPNVCTGASVNVFGRLLSSPSHHLKTGRCYYTPYCNLNANYRRNLDELTRFLYFFVV